MAVCINKKNNAYGLLVDRMGGKDILAQTCFHEYNRINGTEGKWPSRAFEKMFLDSIYGENAVFDEGTYSLGDTKEVMENVDNLILGKETNVETPEFSNLQVQTETVRDSEALKGEIKNLSEKMDFGKGKGEGKKKYSVTGTTALFGNKDYDPTKGPLKESEDTVHTHAGSFVHKVLEDTANFFKDKTHSEGDLKQYIKDNLDRLLTGFDKVKVTNKKARENIAENLTKVFAPILRDYDVLGTEIKLQHTNHNGQTIRGAIDLMIKNKKTGQVGIVDFKTSSEANFVGQSKFNRMADIGIPGSTPFDKVQLQTLGYKEIINDRYRKETGKDEDLVNFRAMVPISMAIDNNTGEIMNMQGAEISSATELTGQKGGRLYGLYDTAKYQQEVGETLGLGGDKVGNEAISLERRIGGIRNAIKNMVSEATKYHHEQIKQDVMSYLTGFNIASDLPSVLESSHKYIDYARDYLKSNPNDLNMISKIESNADALDSLRRSLTGNTIDKGLENYVKEVLHMDPSSEQGMEFISKISGGVDQFTQDVNELRQETQTALHDYMRNTKGPEFVEHYIKSSIIPELVDKQLKLIQADLLEKGDKGYLRHKYEDEATSKAWEIYRQNKKLYDDKAWGMVDDLLNITKGNGRSMNLFERIVNSTLMKKILPMNQNTDLVFRDMVKTVYEGKQKIVDKLRASTKEIDPLAKEIAKLSEGKSSREAYDFMIDYSETTNKNGETVQMPKIIEQYDNDKIDAAKRKVYAEALKSGKNKEEIQKEITRWEAENFKLKPGEDFDEKVRTSMKDRIQELADLGLLTHDNEGLEQALNILNTHEGFENELPSAFIDKKNPFYSKEVSEYVRKIWRESLSSLAEPNEEFLNEKYKTLMSMDENDPRRKFYELYKKKTQMYDLVVPSIKRLGNNLPSMYVSAREAKGFKAKLGIGQGDFLNSEYMKNQNERGGKLISGEFGSEEHTKKWFGDEENFAENTSSFEWSSRLPLAFSGYVLEPDKLSFNLADSIKAIDGSFAHYTTFLPRVAEMEMMCDMYEDGGRVYNPARGTFHDVPKEVLTKMRKFLDRTVYSDKKNQGKFMRILNSYLGWESFKALGYNPIIALKSHFASGATILTQHSGEGELISTANLLKAKYNFLGRKIFQMDSKPRQKQVQLLDYFGFDNDNTIREMMGQSLSQKGLIGTISRLAFVPYAWSDHFHRSTASEGFARTQHVFDEHRNDLGSLYDNLSPDEDGRLKINDKVKFLDKEGSIKYNRLGLQRQIQNVLSVTTSPITDLDRPEWALDKQGRFATMVKTIGLNTVSDALKGATYDPLSGKIRQGMLNVWGDKGGIGATVGYLLNLHKICKMVDKIFPDFGATERHNQLCGRDLKPHQIAAINRFRKSIYTVLAISATQHFVIPGGRGRDDKDARNEILGKDNVTPENWARAVGWMCLKAMATSINPSEAFSAYQDMSPMGMVGGSLKSYWKVVEDLHNMATSNNVNELYVGKDPIWGFSPEKTPKIFEDILKATGVLTIPSKVIQSRKTAKFMIEKTDD